MAVQGGFVAGTLVSALLNLADLVSPRWVFAVGCLGAVVSNALVTTSLSAVEVVAWRFATGSALALVYPPAMKIAAGCVVAGFYADRLGRARVAAWAMMTSATCAALTAAAFHAPYAVLLGLVAIWGFSVVADSAQFSAIVSDTSAEDYVGTALTVQTCLGFLLTMVSIRLTSAVAGWLGWQWAFLLLLPGPVLGVQAMLAFMRPRITRE